MLRISVAIKLMLRLICIITQRRVGMLTRQTEDEGGVWQLGVITRRAVVVGSVPSELADRDEFDTIAYTGRVVVRLLGSCEAGDYIVPSGRQDGTARVARAASGRPVRTVGRALTNYASKDGLRETLVECSVISPSDSVDMRRLRFCTLPRLILSIGACICAVLVFSGLLGAPDTPSRSAGTDAPRTGALCPAVTVSALANGLCRRCDGHDAAVKFAAMRGGGVVQVLCPETHTGNMTRICGSRSVPRSDGGSSGYVLLSDGSVVSGTCTRKACPSQVFPLLPELTMQQYPAGVTPWCMEESLCQLRFNLVPEGTGAVTVPCPTGYGNPFWPGNFTRVCGSGADRWERLPAASNIGASAAAIDSGANTGEDESTTGDCEWKTCPSGCLSLTRSSTSDPFESTFRAGITREDCVTQTQHLQVSLPVPQWSVGESRTLYCCEDLTASHGCADPSAGLGSVEVSCGTDGVWRHTRGGCVPPSSLQLAMNHPDANGSSTVQSEAALWESFAQGLGATASMATGGRWAMPATGRLGRLYIRWEAGDWRHLSTLTKFHTGVQTGSGGGLLPEQYVTSVHGWGVAALAKVACRQLGLGSAYFASVRLFAPFVYKSFCQDRLRTNIGQVEKRVHHRSSPVCMHQPD
jgi:hypothetical protein